jgi:1,4-dihydroxy-2-naphthoate octaprenyltransferase
MLRVTLLNDVAALNSGFTFNPQNFVENLKYMGLGMLAIFIVIGVIVGITYLLNALFQDKNK